MLRFRYPETPAAILALSLTLMSADGWADETAVMTGRQFTLEVGERVWVRSTGRSEFNIAGTGGFPNVLSELKWTKLHSNVFEFHAEGMWRHRGLFRVTAGFGYIDGGQLRDQDFQGANRTMLAADTISAADDDGLSYLNIDVGYRLAAWSRRDGAPQSWIDVLIGYQRWTERYVATQTQDLLNPNLPSPDQGAAVSEVFTYNNLRLGGRTQLEVVPDVALRVVAMALPYTSLHFTDIHHLRATGVDAFRQDPSFVGTFSNPFWNGGWGYQVEAGVAYRVWQTLRVELGYQWWFVRAGAGTLIQRQLVAGDVPAPLNFAKTSRHGVLFGISYTF